MGLDMVLYADLRISDDLWDDTRRCYGCTTCFPDYQSVISYLGIKE